MATVTHYIRSEYDPEADKDRLLKETGQSADRDVDVDPWQTESSSAGFHNSHRLANAPKFVPAVLSYDEWGTAATLSSSARPAPPSSQRRVGRDWFIARAISESQSASAPPTPWPRSSSSSSVADILARHPPSTSAQPFRPPVFLHLGPSNKGWAMLQNQGWSEGEGLGTSTSGRSGNDARDDGAKKEQKARKRSRLDRPSPLSPSQEQPDATEEHILVGDDDDDDPIIEVRKKVHVPTIDLTQSDTEEDEDEDEDDDDDENDCPAPPASTDDHPTGPTSTSTTASDRRGTQTALLTPLPTILKSDRLGIGLKAKTEGPYRSSVKRVTHNAAALAAHIKAAQDMRHTQRELGKGRRAFARAERMERERRQNMMAYLSEP